MTEIKDKLNNPKLLIEEINKGKYTTREVDRAYNEEINLNRINRKPIVTVELRKDYERFLLLNKKYIEEEEYLY